MSRICQITGKKAIVGNHVSHSNKKTKRRFNPNLFTKKFYNEEDGSWVTLKVSAHGIRVIDRIGLKEAMKKAKEKGYLN